MVGVMGAERPAANRGEAPATRVGGVIEKCGHLELGAQPGGEPAGGVDGEAFVGLGVEVDERHDVERAEARVHAVVTREIDPGHACGGEGLHRRLDRLGRSGEGEDRSVVIGIGVHVEEVGPARVREGSDDAGVPSLRHVGYAFDQAREVHRRSVRPRGGRPEPSEEPQLAEEPEPHKENA